MPANLNTNSDLSVSMNATTSDDTVTGHICDYETSDDCDAVPVLRYCADAMNLK